MRHIVRSFIYIVYRFYARGKNDESAYTMALVAILGLILLNIDSVVVFTGLPGIIVTHSAGLSAYQERLFLVLLVFALPGYLVLRWLFPKKEIDELEYDDDARFVGGFVVIVLIILSFVIAGWVHS